MTLQELAIKARSGDERAMEQLCRECMPRVESVLAHLGAGADKEELTQETLVRVLEKIGSYRAMPGGSFEGWLYRVAYNVFIDSRRRKAKEKTLPLNEDIGVDGVDVESNLPQPDTALMNKERDSKLWAAVNKLDDERRAMVVLRYYCDMSYAQIALTMKISPARVKWRLHDALKSLKKLLEGDRDV